MEEEVKKGMNYKRETIRVAIELITIFVFCGFGYLIGYDHGVDDCEDLFRDRIATFKSLYIPRNNTDLIQNYADQMGIRLNDELYAAIGHTIGLRKETCLLYLAMFLEKDITENDIEIMKLRRKEKQSGIH